MAELNDKELENLCDALNGVRSFQSLTSSKKASWWRRISPLPSSKKALANARFNDLTVGSDHRGYIKYEPITEDDSLIKSMKKSMKNSIFRRQPSTTFEQQSAQNRVFRDYIKELNDVRKDISKKSGARATLTPEELKKLLNEDKELNLKGRLEAIKAKTQIKGTTDNIFTKVVGEAGDNDGTLDVTPDRALRRSKTWLGRKMAKGMIQLKNNFIPDKQISEQTRAYIQDLLNHAYSFESETKKLESQHKENISNIISQHLSKDLIQADKSEADATEADATEADKSILSGTGSDSTFKSIQIAETNKGGVSITEADPDLEEDSKRKSRDHDGVALTGSDPDGVKLTGSEDEADNVNMKGYKKSNRKDKAPTVVANRFVCKINPVAQQNIESVLETIFAELFTILRGLHVKITEGVLIKAFKDIAKNAEKRYELAQKLEEISKDFEKKGLKEFLDEFEEDKYDKVGVSREEVLKTWASLGEGLDKLDSTDSKLKEIQKLNQARSLLKEMKNSEKPVAKVMKEINAIDFQSPDFKDLFSEKNIQSYLSGNVELKALDHALSKFYLAEAEKFIDTVNNQRKESGKKPLSDTEMEIVGQVFEFKDTEISKDKWRHKSLIKEAKKYRDEDSALQVMNRGDYVNKVSQSAIENNTTCEKQLDKFKSSFDHKNKIGASVRTPNTSVPSEPSIPDVSKVGKEMIENTSKHMKEFADTVKHYMGAVKAKVFKLPTFFKSPSKD